MTPTEMDRLVDELFEKLRDEHGESLDWKEAYLLHDHFCLQLNRHLVGYDGQ